MHSKKSAISLSLKCADPTKARSQSSFRPGTQSDPCISSVQDFDHDYYFELLGEEEQDAQSITRCCTPSRFPGFFANQVLSLPFPNAAVTLQGNTITSCGGGTSTVPEPGTWGLLGTGLITIAGVVRRRIRI
jgi:hypothetical protein